VKSRTASSRSLSCFPGRAAHDREHPLDLGVEETLAHRTLADLARRAEQHDLHVVPCTPPNSLQGGETARATTSRNPRPYRATFVAPMP